MEKRYYCSNKSCKRSLTGTHVLELNLDAVMDEANLAQMFCPDCKRVLHSEPFRKRPAA